MNIKVIFSDKGLLNIFNNTRPEVLPQHHHYVILTSANRVVAE